MEMLRQAGTYVREYLQKGYENDWEKWNDEMILPVRNIDILGNAVRTILSTYRQTSVKYYRPPMIAQIAGIAIAGLSLYSMFSGTSISPYTNASTEVGKAGAEAGARAYSAENMGFDRSNPELIAGAGMPIKSGYGGF